MNRSNVFLYTIIAILIAGIIAITLQVRDLNSAEQRLQMQAQAQAKQRADDAAAKIEIKFSKLKGVVDSISTMLEQGGLSESQIKALFDRHIDDNQQLGLKQVGVAYKEYSYSAKQKLFAPTYNILNGSRDYLGTTYDYTAVSEDNSWYQIPMKKGAIWHEPYYGKDAQDWLAEYGAPFNGKNAKTGEHERIGVVFANLSLGKVRQLVGELDFGATGYGFILTSEGTIVSHPLEAYLGKQITCPTGVAKEKCLQADDEFVKQSLVMVKAQKSGDYRSVTNPLTGQKAWVYLKPIAPTSWSMAVVLNESDFLVDVAEVRQDRLMLLITVLVSLIALTLIVLRVDKGGRRSMIAASILISGYSFIGIIMVWLISVSVAGDGDYVVPPPPVVKSEAANYNSVNETAVAAHVGVGNVKVYDQPGTESVLSACLAHNSAIEVVPTGVFIQSINFSSANNVTMTGYIWQQLSKAQADSGEINVVFPEAEDVSIEEAYRKPLSAEGRQLIGWYFVATLRQQFGYQKYPFDREDVWLRIWTRDLNRNTVLVPDFNSYDLIDPSTMPGLEENFVLEGWDLENSFFSYRATPYNTRFGFADHAAKNTCPELYFNVGIKRKFISPFISDILPIFIITVLVFAVLLISTKNEEKMGLFGFSTSSVLGYCAALFFVLIVSHVHLRESLAAHGIIYLEYFYFVTYAIILAASANSVIFAGDRYVHLIHYKDNFYIKIAYWPVVLLALLMTTIPNFY